VSWWLKDDGKQNSSLTSFPATSLGVESRGRKPLQAEEAEKRKKAWRTVPPEYNGQRAKLQYYCSSPLQSTSKAQAETVWAWGNGAAKRGAAVTDLAYSVCSLSRVLKHNLLFQAVSAETVAKADVGGFDKSRRLLDGVLGEEKAAFRMRW
jgi:hypothetical protein